MMGVALERTEREWLQQVILHVITADPGRRPGYPASPPVCWSGKSTSE